MFDLVLFFVVFFSFVFSVHHLLPQLFRPSPSDFSTIMLAPHVGLGDCLLLV
jgi:hypothetical protein